MANRSPKNPNQSSEQVRKEDSRMPKEGQTRGAQQADPNLPVAPERVNKQVPEIAEQHRPQRQEGGRQEEARKSTPTNEEIEEGRRSGGSQAGRSHGGDISGEKARGQSGPDHLSTPEAMRSRKNPQPLTDKDESKKRGI